MADKSPKRVETQAEKFAKAARETGAPNDTASFDRALRKLGRMKQKPDKEKKPTK